MALYLRQEQVDDQPPSYASALDESCALPLPATPESNTPTARDIPVERLANFLRHHLIRNFGKEDLRFQNPWSLSAADSQHFLYLAQTLRRYRHLIQQPSTQATAPDTTRLEDFLYHHVHAPAHRLGLPAAYVARKVVRFGTDDPKYMWLSHSRDPLGEFNTMKAGVMLWFARHIVLPRLVRRGDFAFEPAVLAGMDEMKRRWFVRYELREWRFQSAGWKNQLSMGDELLCASGIVMELTEFGKGFDAGRESMLEENSSEKKATERYCSGVAGAGGEVLGFAEAASAVNAQESMPREPLQRQHESPSRVNVLARRWRLKLSAMGQKVKRKFKA